MRNDILGSFWTDRVLFFRHRLEFLIRHPYKIIFSGSYGFAVWMVWVGGGFFLPAAGLAFEGGFINEKGFNYQELMN